MSLPPLNKHTSSWLPVGSCKHAGKSFINTHKKKKRRMVGGKLYAVLKEYESRVGGIFS